MPSQPNHNWSGWWLFMTHPAWSRTMHTLQSNRVVDGTDDCVYGCVEGPTAKDHIQVPHWRRVLLFNMCQALALKGNGRRHSDCFDLCSGQNTPMTDSESKYNPFALCAVLCAQIFPAFYICSWQENIGWSRPHKQFNPRFDDFKS